MAVQPRSRVLRDGAVAVSGAAAYLEGMSDPTSPVHRPTHPRAGRRRICVHCGAGIQKTRSGDASVTGWSDTLDGTDILGSGLLCPERHSPPDRFGCRGHEPADQVAA